MSFQYNILVKWHIPNNGEDGKDAQHVNYGELLQKLIDSGRVSPITLDYEDGFLTLQFKEGDNEHRLLFSLAEVIDFLERKGYEIKFACLDGLENFLKGKDDDMRFSSNKAINKKNRSQSQTDHRWSQTSGMPAPSGLGSVCSDHHFSTKYPPITDWWKSDIIERIFRKIRIIDVRNIDIKNDKAIEEFKELKRKYNYWPTSLWKLQQELTDK